MARPLIGVCAFSLVTAGMLLVACGSSDSQPDGGVGPGVDSGADPDNMPQDYSGCEDARLEVKSPLVSGWAVLASDSTRGDGTECDGAASDCMIANDPLAWAGTTLTGATHEAASEFCSNLQVGDVTSFRLPTEAELQGIADDVSALAGYAGFGATAGTHWTGETRTSGAVFARTFDFDSGFGGELTVSSTADARCVAIGYPTPARAFTDEPIAFPRRLGGGRHRLRFAASNGQFVAETDGEAFALELTGYFFTSVHVVANGGGTQVVGISRGNLVRLTRDREGCWNRENLYFDIEHGGSDACEAFALAEDGGLVGVLNRPLLGERRPWLFAERGGGSAMLGLNGEEMFQTRLVTIGNFAHVVYRGSRGLTYLSVELTETGAPQASPVERLDVEPALPKLLAVTDSAGEPLVYVTDREFGEEEFVSYAGSRPAGAWVFTSSVQPAVTTDGESAFREDIRRRALIRPAASDDARVPPILVRGFRSGSKPAFGVTGADVSLFVMSDDGTIRTFVDDGPLNTFDWEFPLTLSKSAVVISP